MDLDVNGILKVEADILMIHNQVNPCIWFVNFKKTDSLNCFIILA